MKDFLKIFKISLSDKYLWGFLNWFYQQILRCVFSLNSCRRNLPKSFSVDFSMNLLCNLFKNSWSNLWWLRRVTANLITETDRSLLYNAAIWIYLTLFNSSFLMLKQNKDPKISQNSKKLTHHQMLVKPIPHLSLASPLDLKLLLRAMMMMMQPLIGVLMNIPENWFNFGFGLKHRSKSPKLHLRGKALVKNMR